MAVELVTGYAGANHVGADEIRKLVRSLAGKGNYWCESAPTVSMTDSNTFHCTAFYAICGGGLFRIEATDLTVANGSQGTKRNDLVCVEYDKDTSSGVESAQLVVVKGTAGTTAADPTLTTGDLVSGCTKAQFAMARISLSGITVATPTLLLEGLDTANGTVLFDNEGSAYEAPYTLSETAANFRRLDIYFRSDDGANDSVSVIRPNGKLVGLSTNWASGYGMYFKAKAVKISGTTIDTYNDGAYHNGQWSTVSGWQGGGYIAISRVVGFR